MSEQQPGFEESAKNIAQKLPETEQGREMGSSLVDKAKELDAKASPFYGVRGMSQVFGERKFHFHEDLPRVEFVELMGKKFMIKDALVVPKWNGFFGQSRFVLLWVKLESGMDKTTLAGQRVVYDQVEEIKRKRLLPIVVTLNKKPSAQGGDYYILE